MEEVRDFRRVLVANRGEIARRVMRTLREMGLASVAVYSDADRLAPHAREADLAAHLGPAPSPESYLAIERIVAAARATRADAVHPGYGFLAENAAFARACEDAGLVWIGPPAEAIARMGSKLEAKELMAAAGVPVVPGFATEGLGPAEVASRARALGLPVLVKASAGGGGKGMRVVGEAEALADALESARREAESAFGDGTLMVERFLARARHVEVQIFGDAQGNVIHLFERECSIQRRHQKVVEEAPSPAVDEALRSRMGAAAVAAGKAIGYRGAGTVEFLLDPRDGEFYFLEMNTRLQVEHPVTEAVTGLDLVRMQVDVARGRPLPVAQEEVGIRGHAVEARLYAEDPARDFLPAAGRVALWEPPALPGVRVDSGVEAGTLVSAHYDPLLAKVIAHGPTRREAIRRLADALRTLGVGGPTTNRAFLLEVLRHPAFVEGRFDTGFVEEHLPPTRRAPAPDPALARTGAVAAALYEHEARRRAGASPLPASIPSGWRNSRFRPQEVVYEREDGEPLRVDYAAGRDGCFEVACEGVSAEARVLEADAEGVAFEWEGVLRRFRVAVDGERLFLQGPEGHVALDRVPRFPPPAAGRLAGGCVAPMTGVVRQVRVEPGARVEEGQLLVVIEAMKMEHAVTAPSAARVAEVRVRVGQMVDPDEVLVVLEDVAAGDEED
jgi:propionyl-CoA carboxylase alpha chain